jgi:hypothetical protein
MARRRRLPISPTAHVAPPPAPEPTILDEVPLLVRLEREVKAEFAPKMRARLAERIAAEEAARRGTAPTCEQCDRKMDSRGRARTSLRSQFGEMPLHPSVYRCRPCGRQVRPMWQWLGVETGRLTGALARLVALIGVIVPYELAARLCTELLGVEVCPMTVWREVQRLGAACEAYQEQSMRYFNDPQYQGPTAQGAPPDAVVLAPDGCALGMQVRTTRRRRVGVEPLPPLPPVEEGQFREVKTGVLLLPAERLEPSPGRQSVMRRVLVTCLGNADQLFARLSAKLVELNWLGPKTVVVIVGDGAEWIWNRAQWFVNRCEILDFWHAVEKAWEFARLQYGSESKHADKFIHRLATDLRAGRIADVIVRLGRLEPTSIETREKLDTLIGYYTDNQVRMHYDEYLRLGYGIGSGAVESAHKQVVHARLRQAGMRFSEAGAIHLLALRVLLLNEQWSLLDRLTMKPLVACAA